jgi:2-methylcitrate dehydratase PrpD
MHGEVPWANRFRARLSVPYVTAVVLSDGRCWLSQFTPERVAEPAVNAFIADRVTVRADPELVDGTATIEIESTAGDVVRRHVDTPHGDPGDPLSDAEIEAKFRAAAEPQLTAEATERVIALVGELESVEDMSAVLRELRPAAG